MQSQKEDRASECEGTEGRVGSSGAGGRKGRRVGAGLLRAMAEAITYADLRFVKAPLKKSISSQLGQGKGGQGISLIPHPQAPS